MEPFYYQHLTKSEQTIYHAIKTGVTALEVISSCRMLILRESA